MPRLDKPGRLPRAGVVHDQLAWNAGAAAGIEGLASSACPHRVGEPQAASWVSGYIEGKAWRHGVGSRHPLTREPRLGVGQASPPPTS